jgi:very-short-patch-repair endonuclease
MSPYRVIYACMELLNAGFKVKRFRNIEGYRDVEKVVGEIKQNV